MSISQWSTTPGSNATGVTNVNWAEGQAPSTVNNSARQEMADVATWYRNSAEWIDRNDTVAFSSGTIVSFTSQDVTAIYNVGRRIQVTAATPGTLYGRITASSTSGSDTLVTIDWDSTDVLVSEAISNVAIGIIGNSTGTQSLDAGNIARANQFGTPTGTILTYASTTAPTGYLFCGGQGVSRTTYADLFGVIGTSFGSTSTGTFAIPDLRGRAVVALDNLGGSAAGRLTSTAADTLGGSLGSESTDAAGSISGSVSGTAITEANLPSSVTLNDTGCGDVNNGVSGGSFLAGVDSGAHARSVTVSLGSGTAHTHSDTFAFSGSSMSIVQPSIALPYIIKT